MGTANRIFRHDVLERVSGGKSFALSSGEESVITANEDELISGQEMVIAYSYCQLHGVIGFKRMALGEIRRCLKIACCQWNDCITMDKLSSEASVLSISLRLLDPVYAFNDCETRSDLYTRDFRNKDEMTGLASCCLAFFDELAYPRAAWFGDVVFDQGAGIKVVEGHISSVAVLKNGLA